MKQYQNHAADLVLTFSSIDWRQCDPKFLGSIRPQKILDKHDPKLWTQKVWIGLFYTQNF